VTNIRKKQLKEVKDLFWHMVSEVSIHHGRKGVAEQSSLCHGGQEAERENAHTSWLSPFPPLFHPDSQPVG
jgi:cytochrome c